MNAVLRITHIDVRPLRHDNSMLEIVLENKSDQALYSGVLLLHELLTDGSGHPVEVHVGNLLPGERIKLSQTVEGSIRQIECKGYRSSGAVITANLSGLLTWWQSPWSLYRKGVLGSQITDVVQRLISLREV
jgi:hypothetical protein